MCCRERVTTTTDGSMVFVKDIFAAPATSTGAFLYDPSNDPWFKGRLSSPSIPSGSAVIKPNPPPPPPSSVKRSWESEIKVTRKRIMADWRLLEPQNPPIQSSSNSKLIKYTPSAPGAKERMIRIFEKQVDPLEPSKFKHKRLPKPPSASPPVPVMHSPTRPLTVKEQQDWKIPPCISKWKNSKGYTIPLNKRLAADGRKLQQVQINENFVKLSEALYVAEHKAREAVAMRSKVQKELMLKEKDRKEQKLRALAQKARLESTAAAHVPTTLKETRAREERDDLLQHDTIGEERSRERERERRLAAKYATMGKKSKIMDHREKVAHPTLSTKKDADADMYGGADERLEKVMNTHRFNPDKTFSTDWKRPSDSKRDRPEEFENDPFGLEQFLREVKKGKKA